MLILWRAKLSEMGTLISRRSFALAAGANLLNLLPIILLGRVHISLLWWLTHHEFLCHPKSDRLPYGECHVLSFISCIQENVDMCFRHIVMPAPRKRASNHAFISRAKQVEGFDYIKMRYFPYAVFKASLHRASRSEIISIQLCLICRHDHESGCGKHSRSSQGR